MADPIRGHGGFLGFGQQVAHDTAVSLTHFITAKSLGIKRKVERADVDNLGYYGEAPVAHDSYEVSEMVEGPTVHHVGYNDPTMLLLEHCCGSAVDSGAGPTYDHEFTLTDDVPSGTEGLTLHQAYGSGPLANKAETFVGCVVNSWSIGCSVGEEAELEIDWIGKTGGGPAAVSTPTLVDSPSHVEHQHLSAAGVTFAGSKIDQLQRWKLSVKKNLTRVDDMGDLSTQKPIPDGMYEVTLELEWLWSANSLYAAHLAGTFGAVAFTLTDGTHGYAFSLPRCQVGEVDRKVDGPGVLRCSTTLKAYASASAGVLTITLTNDKATTETL